MDIDLESDLRSQQCRGGGIMEHNIEVLCGTQCHADATHLGENEISGEDVCGNNDVVLVDTDACGIFGIDQEADSIEPQGIDEPALLLERDETQSLRRNDLRRFLESSPSPCPAVSVMQKSALWCTACLLQCFSYLNLHIACLCASSNLHLACLCITLSSLCLRDSNFALHPDCSIMSNLHGPPSGGCNRGTNAKASGGSDC